VSDRDDHHPGDRAPITGDYEQLNVFDTPTRTIVCVPEGDWLPCGPRRFTWRRMKPFERWALAVHHIPRSIRCKKSPEIGIELKTPMPNALMGHHDAACQKQLHVAQAQAEDVIQPHGVVDDLGKRQPRLT